MHSLLLCLKKSNVKSNSSSLSARNKIPCDDALFILMTFLTPAELVIFSRVCLAWSKLTNKNRAWEPHAVNFLKQHSLFSEKNFHKIHSIRDSFKASIELVNLQKQITANLDAIDKIHSPVEDERKIEKHSYSSKNSYHYAVMTPYVYSINLNPLFSFFSEYVERRNTLAEINKLVKKNENLSKKMRKLEPVSLEAQMKI